MSRNILLILGLFSFCCLSAQNVQVKMNGVLEEMLTQYTLANKSKQTVPGWRVQVLATTDRQRLESVLQSFRYHYPNVPVDWEHSRPYYKLQAGAFKTKLDALRLKFILSREYEGLYLVRDENIAKQALLNYY